MIAENGTVLASSNRFENGIIYADIDLERLVSDRRRMNTCRIENPREKYDYMDLSLRKNPFP